MDPERGRVPAIPLASHVQRRESRYSEIGYRSDQGLLSIIPAGSGQRDDEEEGS